MADLCWIAFFKRVELGRLFMVFVVIYIAISTIVVWAWRKKYADVPEAHQKPETAKRR